MTSRADHSERYDNYLDVVQMEADQVANTKHQEEQFCKLHNLSLDQYVDYNMSLVFGDDHKQAMDRVKQGGDEHSGKQTALSKTTRRSV